MRLQRLDKRFVFSTLAVGLVGASIVAGMVLYSPLPSDDFLIKSFRDKRASFSSLVATFEDISSDSKDGEAITEATRGIATSRYTQLLQVCKAQDVRRDSLMIKIAMASDDGDEQGQTKGIAYVTGYRPFMELYNSLDGPFFNGGARVNLRHIEGPWYVYLEYYALQQLKPESR